MGANVRLHEWRTERRLAREATKGVVGPPTVASSASGAAASRDTAVRDRRELLPQLGLREYWYPALPLKKVGTRKPKYWRMLGEELVLFRDKDGGVAALSDVCPHRGASLSRGSCFYEGTVACPYHGAVFDKDGGCVAFITEGPESKMVGNLNVRSYPTKVLRGWVFIWMGESEPAPIEDDVPPEFFESEKTLMLDTYTYWASSWILAIENQGDAHNCLYVHRNSVMQLLADRSRARTPVGPRSKLIEDRALTPLMRNQDYYADDDGNVPYQMYYPGVDGVWPKHRWRKWLWSLFRPYYRFIVNNKKRLERIGYPYEAASEEWANGIGATCWHLPCAVRVNFGPWMYTRYAVPVTENLSRIIYFHNRRPRTAFGRTMVRIWFRLYFNWWLHYNFSTQDGRETAPCRYWTEENFAPTDSHLILLRKLVTERSRDAKLRAARAGQASEHAADPPIYGAEERAYQRMEEEGLEAERSLEGAARADEVATPLHLDGIRRR